MFYREGSNFACCRVKMGLGIFNYQHYQMHFYLVHISNLTIFFHVLYVVCCIRISDFKYAIVIFSMLMLLSECRDSIYNVATVGPLTAVSEFKKTAT